MTQRRPEDDAWGWARSADEGQPPPNRDALSDPSAEESWDDEAPLLRRRVLAMAAVLLVTALVGVGLIAAFRSLLIRPGHHTPAASGPWPSAGAGVSGSASPTAAARPVPRDGLPSELDALTAVCEGTAIFPAARRSTGSGPHPQQVFVSQDALGWTRRTLYSTAINSSAADRAWNPTNPGTVQIVACLKLGKTGQKLRDCPFIDPEPTTLPLVHAQWRLRAVEVATGRVLLDRSLPDDDRDCPEVAVVAHDQLEAGVRDATLIAALRPLVGT